jgi:hypothetical protein
LRPRLAFLADLLSDVTGSRRRERRPPAQPSPAAQEEEQLSADEMKERLEATRARLKQDRPPLTD